MRTGLLRALGAATAVIGTGFVYRPGLMARPAGLAAPDGHVDPRTALAVRALGWRDAATGLAMLVAPDGRPLATAAAVRIALDLGDGAVFGTAVPGRVRRAGTLAAAGGWAALTLAGLLGGRRTGAVRAV
ncbi:hypothetical protein QQY24_06505 [Streptomyces sp. TG1A-8]|uniref:hypothetical protein n=1 Tax=Streptomyces sp. TG1A-8 TaxID=3051385 RepID=UPI00265C1AF5|nr:hypothetical protein [Streptomyces sp. TG1A-8]MDO0925086.1 hypothetical protein [Streptomyces sp. TG1A-8]